MSEHVTHWTAQAEWMRDVGANEAAWSPDGQLTHLKLGPVPSPAMSDDPVERRTPLEYERHLRDERRRIALGSSGGPVRRLSADD